MFYGIQLTSLCTTMEFILSLDASSLQSRDIASDHILNFKQRAARTSSTIQYNEVVSYEMPLILVDGTCKDKIGAIGGLIIHHGVVILTWSLNVGVCPSSEYVEIRTMFEDLIKLAQVNFTRA